MTIAVMLAAILLMVGISVLADRRQAQLQGAAMLRAKRALETGQTLESAANGEYLRHSVVTSWIAEHPDHRGALLSGHETARLGASEVTARYEETARILADPFGWASAYNESFVADRCAALTTWFYSRLSNPLTEEQRAAVVTDEDANLVVAGAGSGKTVTVVAKVAYLIEHLDVNPRDILVLAFNRTVAEEISGRIESLKLAPPEVSTFHAKGFEILGRTSGRKPAVSSLAQDRTALRRFLESVLVTRTHERGFRAHFARWWVDLRVDAGELKHDTPDERLQKERSLGLRTLDGTLMKSQSEVKVGDWLTLLGLRWEYEARYGPGPASPTFRDYTPDFQLPDYEVWIEVWACDEAEERFPPELPEEQYREGMKWKRSLHEENETVLVEIYQTDVWNRDLSTVLSQRLTQAGVQIEALNQDDVEAIIEAVRVSFGPLVNLIGSFLSLFRAGGWTRAEVLSRAETERDRGFLALFWPFLDAYEEHLEQEGKIDFDEMLIQAARALQKSAEQSDYKYIIVDEYQDTSRAQLKLIRQLRGSTAACQLFLVGDDWQSIYRFTGADIAYFTDVETSVGATARTDLGRTFRLCSDVAELSTHFITKSPDQLQKTIEPRVQEDARPGVSIRLYTFGRQSEALRATLEEIRANGTPEDSILVLGRYNFLLAELDRYDLELPRNLARLTVHRAKELEADHVIVLGLENGTFGFPTEIEDDRVIRMLLSGEQQFPNAEERRLFYVALTRTRTRAYLLASAEETSPFVLELLRDEYSEWVDQDGEAARRYRCPRCRGRTIRRHEGPHGLFWACGHYPACSGRLVECSACGSGLLEPSGAETARPRYVCTGCGTEAPLCPRCRVGAITRRDGARGPFLGCAEWRQDGSGCDYTTILPPG